MALILTVLTTPLTLWIYPSSIRKLHSGALAKVIGDIDGPSDESDIHGEKSGATSVSSDMGGDIPKSRFTVVLERIEHLPAIMTLVQLLQPPPPRLVSAANDVVPIRRPITIKIDALRLIELSERTSAVMRGSDSEELLRRDALVNVFQMFGHLNRIAVSSTLSVVPQSDYSSSVISHGDVTRTDLIVLPWSAGLTHVADELPSPNPPTAPVASYNPFATLFGQATPSTPVPADSSVQYSQFIRQVFSQAKSDVALFVDRGLSAAATRPGVDGQHIFLPFFGGPDDRLALSVIVQLCAHNPAISATIVRVTKSETPDWDLDDPASRDSITIDKQHAPVNFTVTSVSISALLLEFPRVNHSLPIGRQLP